MADLIPLAYALGGMLTIGLAVYDGLLDNDKSGEGLLFGLLIIFVFWPVLFPASIGCRMRKRAQAIEARRADTGTGSVHESAVATPCAQTSPHPSERSAKG